MSVNFEKALPIWIKDREDEKHLRLQFKAIVKSNENLKVKIATSGIYQLWVNGSFVSYGPARAGKNHFRMDEISIVNFLEKEDNIVVIEVAGYNVNSYYIQKQPSFLQAEISSGNDIFAATGFDFTARVNPNYIQRVQRYSYQRPMIEAYKFSKALDSFFVDDTKGTEEISVTEKKKIIERLAPYPAYEKIKAVPILHGEVEKIVPQKYFRDRSCVNIGGALNGFTIEELDFFATDRYQELKMIPNMNEPESILNNTYNIYRFPHNASGMITATLKCKSKTTLYILFDELLAGETIHAMRGGVANIIAVDLTEGEYDFQAFEIYTMKYVQFVSLGGECEILDVGMTEYKHPPVREIQIKDPDLKKIAEAAIENYRQNAVDIPTDCPSRERGGWLCDSFFIARTEYFLEGKNPVEKSFLENFLHEDKYLCLPDGVFPMCYPADHFDSWFLPNWSLWLILELKDYLKRTGDSDLISRYSDRIYRTFEFFSKYENEDGLLENLPAWVFIEWSKANDFVQDVNYPSNMLYSLALKTASELTGNEKYARKSEFIKEKVKKLSYNGLFFTDNAVRKDGVLVNTGETSETCQYYAFFCGLASPKTHSELFSLLVNEFGSNRKDGKYDNVYPSAPFIGKFLRLDMLMKYGYTELVKEDIRKYFLSMAQLTGTLWEKDGENDSCNHGFASYVSVLLEQSQKGE